MFDGHGFFGGGFMWLFWVLILAAIFLLLKGVSGNSTNASSSESPMEILRKRYASGEISDEEFESRRKELEK